VIKLCTGDEDCIVCPFVEDVHDMRRMLKKFKAEGEEFICCFSEETARGKCLRISDIATIEEVPRSEPEDDDEDEDRGPVFGNPEVVIITGGREMRRRRRRSRRDALWPPTEVADAESVSHEDEGEPPAGQ
jgi:hypothetical protein